jgi:aryl-alcohol dehydrogenase-like predicted oxidoreductase
MELKRFNHTDLIVSPICLGTVNYGSAMNESDSQKQMDEFLDLGGNFIDTAHVYGDWAEGKTSPSEKAIGQWFQKSGKRSSVVLATKGAHPLWTNMSVPRVHASDIAIDLEESLRYLKTDYIDLYFLHRDDRKVPVQEIIDGLDKAVQEGKIRYYGCSNWGLDRIQEAAAYATEKGSKGFVCNQLMLSLADINFYNLPDKTFILMDEKTHAYQAQTGLNAMAYMSIAKAFFTRKYAGEKLPESVTSVYENESNSKMYELCKEIVASGTYSFMDLSLMYVMAEKNFPTVPIASFDTSEQLQEGLSCWNKQIPEELIEKLASFKKYVYLQ